MADLIYQGQTYVENEPGVSNGINIPRRNPTEFKFLNNSVTSINNVGYMIQAGDEGESINNNNLKGEIIQGNKFIWNGDYNSLSPNMVITHGVFTGCNEDVIIRYNYLYRVPMGIIRKSATNMVDTKGHVSYNIVKTYNVGGVVKGMNGIRWYNNTFYNDRTPTETNRAAIDIYENSTTSHAHNIKIKNNIFYSKYKTRAISITTDSREGFESDYNIYWVEEGDHKPIFVVGGATKTWEQWQALGYDQHSVIMNPDFIDFETFVPRNRLNHGINLGNEFERGLATTAKWTVGVEPTTTTQNGAWQVGAIVHAGTINIPPTVTTTTASNVTYNSATLGGNVTNAGSSSVTERGICWNTSLNPTVNNNKIAVGSGTGSFTVLINTLSPNTTYYVRSYAVNAAGTVYGSNVSFTTPTYVPISPYFVAANGNDETGNGTIEKPWFSLTKAWQHVKAGETIYMRGGTYYMPTRQNLTGKSGTANNMIKVHAYNNENVIMRPAANTEITYGIYVSGNYIHLKHIEIAYYEQKTPDKWYNGISAYNSNHCIFEELDVHHNGFGFSIGGNSTGNLVLNSDFHHNWDPITAITNNRPYGGADGLTIRVPDPTSINTVRGCRMWNNSDDGFDGFGNAGLLIFEDSWAFNNGYREDGVTEGGNGHGFKIGPIVHPEPWSGYENELKRIFIRCIAFENRESGFTQNATKSIMHFYNNISFQNKVNGFILNNFPDIKSIAMNNISYRNGKRLADFTPVSELSHNTFLYNNKPNPQYNISDADFISIDPTGTDGPRQADGSLPNLPFLKLSQGSGLINTGIDVGLPYIGSAPDLGPYESNYITTIEKPKLNTKNMTNVTYNSAKTGGIILGDGNSPITAKGVCWNTSSNPTINNTHTNEGSGTGEFTSTIINLVPDTKYYVRAYATNAAGTSYGEEKTFTTLKETFAPTVITVSVSDVTESSIIVKGSVFFDGNTSIIQKGFCFNTTGNPTTSDAIVYNIDANNMFTTNILNLQPNTTYFIRAFAINTVGTSYGEIITFTTLKILTLPVVITSNITNITKNSATAGGNITFDGYDNILSKGVVWDTMTQPNIESNRTFDGTGTGAYQSHISPISPNTKYYVRAYAENSQGFAYGDEKNFTTLPEEVDLKIYPNPVPMGTSRFRIEVTVPGFDSVRVYFHDMTGRTIYTERMNCWLINWIEGHSRNEAIIPTRKFKPGTYIVRVINKKGIIVTGKVVIL